MVNCYCINMGHKHNELSLEEWALKVFSILSYLSGFMTLSSACLAFTPRRFQLKDITRSKRNMSKSTRHQYHYICYLMHVQLNDTCIPAAYYLWTVLRGIWGGVQRAHLLQRGSMKIPRGLLENLAASVQHPGDEWRMRRRMEKISFHWEAEAACIWPNRKKGTKNIWIHSTCIKRHFVSCWFR